MRLLNFLAICYFGEKTYGAFRDIFFFFKDDSFLLPIDLSYSDSTVGFSNSQYRDPFNNLHYIKTYLFYMWSNDIVGLYPLTEISFQFAV